MQAEYPMAVRLQLFGAPKVESGGESIALPFERRIQVLVLAALRRSWVGRAELAAMLWPDQASKLAYSNVRKTLFRLKALPWADQIELQGSAVRFDAASDVLEFDTALREQRIGDALPLNTGELLRGFEDDRSEAWSSWLNFERERLRSAWRSAALKHLAGDIDPGEAIAISSRLLEADPLDEAAIRAHLAWLGKAGQGMRARSAYRDFVERLSNELGLSPAADLVALNDTLGTPAQPLVPPPAADNFVGRAIELRKVAELLAQPECRLLCIVGPGGMGKTRLARKAADSLAGEYRDGAAFVSIEGVAAPDQFGGRVARELGLSLAGSAQPMDQVNEFLRDRHMLVALDNVEDFGAHAPLLAKILQSCPRVKILATSRVRLGIASEWSLPLEGLPVPEPEDRGEAGAFDAVRLFIAAARRVDPSLEPENEMGAIVDICRAVEGVPLAIELAAGWTRVLSCAAIAQELLASTQLLGAVEEVFDQSWRRLTAIERDVLARLSVFQDGFTPEAARAVANASLPVLGALMDKSLLRKEGARNQLHSLVHQLSSARLEGESRAAAEAAHAHYFHRLLAQTRRAVENGDSEALRTVDMEFENCRAAWAWSVAHGDAESLARSVMPLLGFCDLRGRFEECMAMLEATAQSEPLTLSALAHLHYRMDRYAEAEALTLRALAATKTSRDHETRLQCFKNLGATYLRLGRYEESRRQYRLALQQSPAHSDPHNAAAMLDNIALVEKRLGNYDEARRLSMDSLVQHRRLNDVAGEALCLNNLGDLELVCGNIEAAATHFTDSLALCDRHGLVTTRVLVLSNLAEIALEQGKTALAEERARRALEIAHQIRNRGVECAVRLNLARAALQRRDAGAARAELRSAIEIALAIGRVPLQRECLRYVAQIEGRPLDPGADDDALREALHRFIVS
jgi:predicted ATPase/DNA-binding SARP family transcriptional activator/Tfp pilus assembly protein PilF